MRILLDTHILLWALNNSPNLSGKARELISKQENEVYYSLISLWEIEIKHMAHPKELPVTAKEVEQYCIQSGYLCMPIRSKHIFELEKLKRPVEARAHKDPFDRLLICQASSEDMLFATHDALLPAYNKACIVIV